MARLWRFLALSDHPLAVLARRIRRGLAGFGLPAPRIVVRPALALVLLVRSIYYFTVRIFICEPLFKAYCTSYGRNLRTGVFLHWVQGLGTLTIGDNVVVDGKSSFHFAVRYCDRPELIVGDDTGIGHNCSFTVGKRITIGRHCRIGLNVQMFDSPGHASDPAARLAGLPAAPEEVRPITIGDNVWVGNNSIICPGVTIGDGSTVAVGSVVMSNVPENTLVAGNPARRVQALIRST
jgi:acetyltransferase-like isoleucine patch superfamily enzyme